MLAFKCMFSTLMPITAVYSQVGTICPCNVHLFVTTSVWQQCPGPLCRDLVLHSPLSLYIPAHSVALVLYIMSIQTQLSYCVMYFFQHSLT